MADFISALTGVQMDSALLDMAEHNSEAYAVGERNGIAVASDDVTYHNNARYYAQIASSQIVGDASSAVRWDTDQSEVLTDAQKAVARNNINAASDSDVVKITSQTLTSAEQAQARANIMAGGSNRNLLDNPWFTVNQRSASGTVTPIAYVADRWQVFSGSATAGTYPTINASSNIGQKIAFDIEAGKTYTFSVLLADGTIVSGTKAVADPNTTISFISNSLVELDYFGAQSPKNIRIYNTSGAALGVKAAKIELGSVSTLANDAPPDYGEELAKCGRYFFRAKGEPIAVGYVSSNLQYVYASVPALAPMRATPTISYSGGFTARLQGASIAITSMYASTPLTTGNAIGVRMVLASSTSATGPAAIYGDANGYIDLSAEP